MNKDIIMLEEIGVELNILPFMEGHQLLQYVMVELLPPREYMQEESLSYP